MTNKTLLYKFEYDIINDKTTPNFSPEEIGHILLKIEKGFGPYETPLFEGKKYELKKFPVSFRNVIEETRKDITFLYKEPSIKIKSRALHFSSPPTNAQNAQKEC